MPLLRRRHDPGQVGGNPGVQPSASFFPIDVVAPWQAAGGGGSGIRANPQLSEIPGIWPGLQLDNGVQGLRSNWFSPTLNNEIQVPALQGTQHQVNVPGAQRWGGAFSGHLGMINVEQMRSRVLAAQIAQSGLQATQLGQMLLARSGVD